MKNYMNSIELMQLLIIGLIAGLSLSQISCSRSTVLRLEELKLEDTSQFTGKTLQEALEYLHKRYGYYDAVETYIDWDRNGLQRCEFCYYDQVYIYVVKFYFDIENFRYVPKHISSDDWAKRSVEFTFPLRLLKKEKIATCLVLKEVDREGVNR